MKQYIYSALALLAISNVALADTEGCTALGATATDAGLTGLVGAITTAAPVLEESAAGQALLAAVSATDELPTDEQVTVFAPTNAAFESALEALGGDITPAALADVLLNHVVVGPLTADSIGTAIAGEDDGAVAITTLLGGELLVTASGTDIFVQSEGLESPGASVVIPDVITCVGPVHVIDTVLLPAAPAAPAPAPIPEMMLPAEAPETACSGIDVTATDAGLSALVDAITFAAPSLPEAVLSAVSASESLPADMRVTVFAPTDEAFEAAANKFGGSLPEDEEVISQVLLNHIVAGELSAADIIAAVGEGGGSIIVESLLGSELFVTTVDDDLFVQSRGLMPLGANVAIADVTTCAGVVHVIDQVLLPMFVDGTVTSFEIEPQMAPNMAPDMAPADGPEEACASIGETATGANLTALVDAITFAAPSLPEAVVSAVSTSESIPSDMRVTVFAPTNEAFEAAANKFGGTLPEDEDLISEVLLNHIVAGELSAADIIAAVGEGGGSIIVESLLGSELFVTTVDDDLFVQSRGLMPLGANVAIADVTTCAGVVHVIDQVLLPTFVDGTMTSFEIAPGMAPDQAPVPAEMPSPGPTNTPMPAPASTPDMAPAPGPMGACAPLGTAATEAGLTALVEAITASTPALEASEAGSAVLGAVAATDAAPEEDRVTVFAPTNEAFEAAAAAFGGELPAETVPDVLLNHVVVGDLTAAAILETVGAAGGSALVMSLGGGELFVSTVGDDLYVQSAGLEAPGALAVTPDVITCSGPVHVINAVLLPSLPDGSMLEVGERDIALTPEEAVAPEEEEGGSEETVVGTDSEVTPDTGAAHGGLAMWLTVGAAVASALAVVA